MKKLKLIILTLLTTVSLMACSEKVNSETYTLKTDDIKMEVTILSKGEDVVKEISKTTIKYTNSSREEVNSTLSNLYKKMENVDGIKTEINSTETESVASTEIDYEKLNREKAKTVISNRTIPSDKKQFPKLKEIQDQIIKSGFTKQEK